MADQRCELLEQFNRQTRRADALYHRAAAHFNQSDCVNWLLYVLLNERRSYSQQDLCEEWMYTKQTINSAVRALQEKGYVMLESAPDNRRRKLVRLTETGRAYALATGGQVYQAETRAIFRLGEKKMAELVRLTEEHLTCLEEEINRMIANTPSETEEKAK